MRADRYTRLVTWLKVILPLTALGLLSTLFLLSRSIDPSEAIPFADKDIQDRLRNQQVTGPFFSGTTADGDQLSFAAEMLTTPNGTIGANAATGVSVRVNLADGPTVTIQSDEALFDLPQNQAILTGKVLLATSAGYEVTTQKLITQLTALDIRATGGITATGPPGELTAGTMQMTAAAENSPVHLIFNNGVKLIYNPKQPQE